MTRVAVDSGAAGSAGADLRILATSDLHVHIFPYDYHSDQPSDGVGLARTATLIAEARAEAANSILLDNGDFLQGNPMGDYVALGRGVADDSPHPMIAAMNLLGYDAAAIGNHEFDYGYDFLLKVLGGAAFPLLCANIAGAGPAPRGAAIRPYVLLDRRVAMTDGTTRALRIGIAGFVPPQIMQWMRRLRGKIVARDILEAAAEVIPRMRAEGADIVIALAHSGIGPAEPRPGMENAATALAALPGIDAVVAGHSHLVFPSPAFAGMPGVDPAAGTIGGKPAVMPGFRGSHLGIIDLGLSHDGTGWQVTSARSEARPILRRNPDWTATPLVASAPGILNAVARDHAATLAYVRRPIGHSDVPLHSYFALVTETDCTRIVAEAQKRHVQALLKGTAHAGLPVLSATAPFKAGGRGGAGYYTDIPDGDLALRHLADLYPYPNTIRAVRVTGAMVAGWLERSAGIYRQIRPGLTDQMLIDLDFPCYNFDTISGLTYRIDPSQPSRFGPRGELLNPAARRITDLRLNGKPLDPAAEVIIATNSYRASGGGEFPGLADNAATVIEGADANRDILVRHVLSQGSLRPMAAPAWRFVALPGTSALFDTAPAALRHADGMAHLRLEAAGRGEDGFARFRIHL